MLLDCSDGAARIVQPVHASAGLCTFLGGGIVRMRIPVHDPWVSTVVDGWCEGIGLAVAFTRGYSLRVLSDLGLRMLSGGGQGALFWRWVCANVCV